MGIQFGKKDRKDPSSQLFMDETGEFIVIGRDYALQNKIDEVKAQTRARSCFRECRACGACSNSKRDNTYPKEYDDNSKRWIDCRGCESFRFHDCNNGWMRNSRGEAEPFTPDAIKLLKDTGGKPLI